MRLRSLLLVLPALAGFASAAHADDIYTVDSCVTATGAAATVEGWTFNRAGIQQRACPRPGIVASEPPIASGNLEGFNVTFTAPAPAQIVGYRLWRHVAVQPNWNYTLYRGAPTGRDEDVVERCWTIGNSCSGVGDDNFGSAPDVTERAIATSALVFHVDCNQSCPGGGPSNVKVGRLQVDLSDRIDPTLVGTPSGDVLDTTRPLTGVRSLSFSASDQGSGIYSARLEVDGQSVAAGPMDDNGGRCVKPFKDLVPCKPTASGTLSVDTATLPDGPHAVRLVVTDATETNTVAYGPVQVTFANQTSDCDAGSAAELSARFASTRKTTLTRRGGTAFTLTGTLAGAAAGAPVTLLSRESRTGAGWITAASAVTQANGAYRLAVPAGRSRSLRVAYRPAPTARTLRCSKPLSVRVPARVRSFAAKRVSVRRFRLSGRLLGGAVPSGGALVELQGYERGAWRRFDTVRTNASGRFATAYRFRSSSLGRSFRLRARVRADAAYPFSLGYSKVIRVRVR